MGYVLPCEQMQQYWVQSFGCRASQADGAALEASLREHGFAPAREAAAASLVVLNSCTVTAAADSDLRQAVRRTHRENPEASIVVTGCYAQRAPDEIAGLPGVSLVLGTADKMKLGELAGAVEGHGRILVSDLGAPTLFAGGPLASAAADRTRPTLKIQDGCSNRCAFCVIPHVRGRSRSAPAEDIVERVRVLAAEYREVVLTGINLGRWGREGGGGLRLSGLVRHLLAETGVERLRLSSVEPMDWSDELLEVMAASLRVCRHVHAPLQSGSDAVLRRMRRKYRTRHYADRLARARQRMPDCAVGADVLVGFPGETEVEFQETVAFVTAMPLTYLHVFTYSERPETEAVELPGAVPMSERRRRNRVLQEVGLAKQAAFAREFVGQSLPCITLREPSIALTSQGLRVRMSQVREANRIVELAIGAAEGGELREQTKLLVL